MLVLLDLLQLQSLALLFLQDKQSHLLQLISLTLKRGLIEENLENKTAYHKLLQEFFPQHFFFQIKSLYMQQLLLLQLHMVLGSFLYWIIIKKSRNIHSMIIIYLRIKSRNLLMVITSYVFTRRN